MKAFKPIIVIFLLVAMGASASFNAQAADAKRGRVYYRMVCTVCHMEKMGGPISPSSRKRAEWASYFQADKHDKGKDTVKQYLSKEYRASIKAKN